MAVPSSAPVLPVPRIDLRWALPGHVVDLATRALVVGVVPAPRFGREGEVIATATALAAAGADLVDVSLPPRLIGPVAALAARGDGPPVVVRVGSPDEAGAARRAGAQAIIAPAGLVAEIARGDGGAPAGPTACLVTDVARPATAGAATEALALPLAVDVSAWSGGEALARETLAIAGGCRLVVTSDPRRTRRVVEVMAALLDARRSGAGGEPEVADERAPD
ncbi:MAG TPA: hypothetical protein VFI47_16120 [Acidimicrobiales bacterium]|nr:hypothetical protein [Acidimicrobiales bacterium]